MQEIAEVYARSLFEVAQAHDVLDEVHDELDEFADAIEQSQDLRLYFFSPYFSSQEKRDGIHKVVDGADERFLHFLEMLAERHRLPFVHRIRREFDELWSAERRILNVEVTSAVELDEKILKQIGERIEEQTGRSVDLSASVDADVLGGLVIRVGNMVLDASVRRRLEQLRRDLERAA
ncbi:MAG: ATP synthase F1 subunit delta [Actinomycetota bacterium]|nr:ATP synthase F1 subunit delta [Actinomycetota bacterium]